MVYVHTREWEGSPRLHTYWMGCLRAIFIHIRNGWVIFYRIGSGRVIFIHTGNERVVFIRIGSGKFVVYHIGVERLILFIQILEGLSLLAAENLSSLIETVGKKFFIHIAMCRCLC